MLAKHITTFECAGLFSMLVHEIFSFSFTAFTYVYNREREREKYFFFARDRVNDDDEKKKMSCLDSRHIHIIH